MSIPFKVVIPARYGSTRLPGKPLLTIAGKPMIIHVCEKAQAAGANSIVVATDDDRIFQAVTNRGFNAMMTSASHQSGTERIAEVAEQLAWDAKDIVVNLQGDEPLIPTALIREVAVALATQEHAGMATLAAKIDDWSEIFNPNAVKVVTNQAGYAMYFSRAPIPWERDCFNFNKPVQPSTSFPYLRHIGMYAYTVDFLKRYCCWPASELEAIEALEQLRILWQGERIVVKTIAVTPPAGVDTEEDLRRVEQIMLAK